RSPYCSGVARRPGPRRVEFSGDGIGVLDADLALQAVRIAEEQTEHRPEVGDEVVGRGAGHEALADRLEILRRGGLGSQVIEPAAAEHRDLAVSFGVALYLEDVELGPVADLDDGETGAAP